MPNFPSPQREKRSSRQVIKQPNLPFLNRERKIHIASPSGDLTQFEPFPVSIRHDKPPPPERTERRSP
jgi:hypothetical protein